MNWFTLAQNKEQTPSAEQLEKEIKKIVTTHPFFQTLMKNYCVSPKSLKNLNIQIKPLEGRHAEADRENIVFNENEVDADFLSKKLFIFVHEFIHWLQKNREKECYFADEEEIECYIQSVAWEIFNGSNFAEIYSKVFPIIEGHFPDKDMAVVFFKKLYLRAKKLIQSMKNKKNDNVVVEMSIEAD